MNGTGETAPNTRAGHAIPPCPRAMTPLYKTADILVNALAAVYLRMEVHGAQHVPAEGGVLVAPTHCSFLDPPLVGAALPRQAVYLAREGIIRMPLLGPLARAMGGFPIRRGAGDREAIGLARALLGAGWPLVIFPEGTRSHDGRLGPIQPGFALIADGPGGVTPILPVMMQDTFKAFPRKALLPKPARVRVAIGEPYTLPSRAEGERSRAYYERCAADLAARYRALGAQ